MNESDYFPDTASAIRQLLAMRGAAGRTARREQLLAVLPAILPDTDETKRTWREVLFAVQQRCRVLVAQHQQPHELQPRAVLQDIAEHGGADRLAAVIPFVEVVKELAEQCFRDIGGMVQ